MAKSQAAGGGSRNRGGGVGPRGGGVTTVKDNDKHDPAKNAHLRNCLEVMRRNGWHHRHEFLKWCTAEHKDAICANMGPDEILEGRCTGAQIRRGSVIKLKDTPPYIVKPRTPAPCRRQASLWEFGFCG